MMAFRYAGVSTDRDGDQLRAALSHRHRRLALRSLAEADAELHLADLARDVVRLGRDAGRGPTAGDDVGPIYVQLYHKHVPRLCDAGVVAFDTERKLVSPTSATHRIAASLPGGDDW